MKFILILLFMALLFTRSFSQPKSIEVVDKDSGSPLNAFSIGKENGLLISTSGGQFPISQLIGMEVTIVADGYESKTITVSDTLSRIELERSAITLTEPVIITAKRFNEREGKLTDAVTTLTAPEIAQVSPRTTPELLMGSTGIWVQKTNHGGGSPIIRGLVGNQILLMVDGIRMNNATYRYGPNQYLATVDPMLIQSLEAVRGSGSVLYGSDALGGVINILSRKPFFSNEKKSWAGHVGSVLMTDNMEKSIYGNVGFSSKRVGIYSATSFRDFGSLSAGGSLGTLVPTAYSEWATDSKIQMKTFNSGVVTASFQHHQQNQVPRYDQVEFGGYEFFNFDPQIRQLGYVRWNLNTPNKYLDGVQLTAALNRSVERTVSQKKNTEEVRRLRDDIKTYSISAETYSRIADWWSAQSGVDFYYDGVSSDGHVESLTSGESVAVRGNYADGATSGQLSVFTSHVLDVGKFNVSAGGRYTYVSLKVADDNFGAVALSPSALVWNIGVSYAIVKNVLIHTSANSAFRAPNVDDVSRFGPVESTVFEIPSPSLRPEKAHTIEVGLKGQSNVLRWGLWAYHTRLTDLIDRVPAQFQGLDSAENRKVYQKYNVNEARVNGIEGSGDWLIRKNLKLSINATYTRGQNVSKQEAMRRIPPFFGRISLNYTVTKAIWVRADYLLAGDQSRLAGGDRGDVRISSRLVNGVAPGWSVLNLYTGYNHKHLSVSLSALNLFDKGYRVYASGVDGIGRAIKIAVSVKF
jgi:iron complex outermembrane receptor protein/hemoglobin/transferrin/lactoferrin receptor protein